MLGSDCCTWGRRSGGHSSGQSANFLPGSRGLEIAGKSRGVHGGIGGAHGRACVHVPTAVCLRPEEDAALCVLGSCLDKNR